MMDAPATNAVTFTPRSDSTMTTAMLQITAAAVLRRTAVSVRDRRSDRRSVGAPPGMAERRLCMPPTMRRMLRRASQLRTSAMTRTETTFVAREQVPVVEGLHPRRTVLSGIGETVATSSTDAPDPPRLGTVALR